MKRILIFLLLFSKTISAQFIPNYKPIVDGKEDRSNKTTDTLLGTSNNYYPTQKAVKSYVDNLGLSKLDKGYSISELRSLNSLKVITTQIFYCNEIGKEGFWKYKAGSSQSDNLGTILVTSSGLRLERVVITGYLKFSWFDDGIVNNGSDNFDKLNDACYLLGKSLYLPENDTIIVNKKYLIYNSIIGNNCLIKLKSSSTITIGDPILYVSANNVTLKDFTLNGNKANNAGTSTNGILGIRANQVKFLSLINVRIIGTRQRGLTVQNSPNFTMKDCLIDSCGRYGTEMSAPQSDRLGALIDNNTATKGSEYYMGSESVIENTTVTHSGLDGLVLGCGLKVKGGNYSYNGQELTNFYDGGAGIYTRPPQNILNAELNGLEITGVTATNNTGIGIDIGNNAYGTNNTISTNILISSNFCSDNYSDGIAIGGTINTTIVDNFCWNNGVRALYFDGTVNKRRVGIGINTVPSFINKNILIENNRCYDSRTSGKTQQYGFYIQDNSEASGAEDFIIRNNNFIGNNIGSALLPVSSRPVIGSSVFNFSNNAGDSYFTIIPTTNSTISPLNSHIYLNASGAVNVTGIDLSILNTVVTLENISANNVTLVNSSTFKLLGNANLVLSQNQVAKFMFCYQTGVYLWKQINTDNEVFNKVLTGSNTISGSNTLSGSNTFTGASIFRTGSAIGLTIDRTALGSSVIEFKNNFGQQFAGINADGMFGIKYNDTNLSDAPFMILPSGQVQINQGFKTADNTSVQFRINSTTKGFLMPSVTTTQRNAISSPADGLEVYDNTLKKPYFYDNTTWRESPYIIYSTSTLDFSSIASNQSEDLTFTLTGAIVGDAVVLGIPNASTTNGMFMAWVSATNTITVRFHNTSGGTADPASGTFKATIIR